VSGHGGSGLLRERFRIEPADASNGGNLEGRIKRMNRNFAHNAEPVQEAEGPMDFRFVACTGLCANDASNAGFLQDSTGALQYEFRTGKVQGDDDDV
jgi:hypothetical protein